MRVSCETKKKSHFSVQNMTQSFKKRESLDMTQKAIEEDLEDLEVEKRRRAAGGPCMEETHLKVILCHV